jgi:Antidote-toxin recognition MazE, bacterial antitoxin
MSTNAKLFMSGRSQAMRLPAKLRLQAQEVRIEQIGDALWLQPLAEAPWSSPTMPVCFCECRAWRWRNGGREGLKISSCCPP